MLSVGEAVAYLSQKGTTKRFKPWWEYVIDYLIHCLFMIVLVSWRFVLQETTFGVACMAAIPVNQTFWSTLYAKYFSEKCALEEFSGYLVRFPSLVFFQWIILFFCQMFWYGLPCVKTKLVALNKLLRECGRAKCTLTNKTHSDWMEQAYAKWKFLFEDHSLVCTIYFFKCFAIVFVSSTSFLLFLPFSKWSDLWTSRNIAYKAIVKDGPLEARINLYCNIGSARLTFQLIVLNLIILLMLTGLSILFLLYSLQKRGDISSELEQAFLSPNEHFSCISKNSNGWTDICLIFAFYDACVYNRAKWREEIKSNHSF